MCNIYFIPISCANALIQIGLLHSIVNFIFIFYLLYIYFYDFKHFPDMYINNKLFSTIFSTFLFPFSFLFWNLYICFVFIAICFSLQVLAYTIFMIFFNIHSLSSLRHHHLAQTSPFLPIFNVVHSFSRIHVHHSIRSR